VQERGLNLPNKELTLYETEAMLTKLDTLGPCRITKQLPSGKIAILQIADPNAVSWVTKSIREIPCRWIKSIEAAIRVGFIVYRNSMRGSKVRKGKFKADRKKVKINPEANEISPEDLQAAGEYYDNLDPKR